MDNPGHYDEYPELTRADEMTSPTPSPISQAAGEPISHERAFHIALVLEMSELSDRNSPEDDPSAMVADSNEMAGCIERALERADLVLVPPTAPTTGSAPMPNMMARCENRAFVTVGFKSPEECSAFIRAVNHAPPASPAASVPLAFESALTELVNKIDTGLDSGDLLIDARRASDALDAILTKGDLVANAYDYFRDSPGHYENSREFRIGWNACLDAIGAARAALLVASTGGDKS